MMIFNWVEFDSTGKPAPKMAAVMDRHYNNSLFHKYPDILIARGGVTWASFYKEACYLPTKLEKVEAVHKLWNSRKWKSDQANWHTPDYWATPLEFAMKGGDCEDYAIAKLLSLEQLGVTTARIVIGINHALLYVRLDEDGYVSDNVGKLRKSFPDGFEPLLSVSTTNVYNLIKVRMK